MKKNIRLAIAQINCTVGDLDGNASKMVECIQKASRLGADIISFPELSVTGYPPEDLLYKKKFLNDNLEALKKVARAVGDMVAIVGFVDVTGDDIYNSAAVIYKAQIKGVYRKIFLPNYGVFDEKRYFKGGTQASVFRYGDIIFGVNICEDIWHENGPVAAQKSAGAGLILNINSSPYYAGKIKEREDLIRGEARKNDIVIAYANLVGGQDELVFDGQSMLIDDSGRIVSRLAAFKEDMLIADVDIQTASSESVKEAVKITDSFSVNTRPEVKKTDLKPLGPEAEVYGALELGLRDYVRKNGFSKVVLGLSGGIDSSLVAALACDAMGKENVTGVYMPTRYSSAQSEQDAKDLAERLGIQFLTISIEQLFKMYLLALEPKFVGSSRDITEENLQARIRGTILMAFSNKFGWLVLTTGNKSEISTGYATLYGDMAGGFSVIKDVPKMLVYKLARYRNSIKKDIPESVLSKEPTAELRHDQKDRDTLPPYELLDQVLKAYVEEDKGFAEIVSMGFDKEMVGKVLNMVDRSEYKRRQAPPGVKITPKAFGKDRRIPITSRYINK